MLQSSTSDFQICSSCGESLMSRACCNQAECGTLSSVLMYTAWMSVCLSRQYAASRKCSSPIPLVANLLVLLYAVSHTNASHCLQALWAEPSLLASATQGGRGHPRERSHDAACW